MKKGKPEKYAFGSVCRSPFPMRLTETTTAPFQIKGVGNEKVQRVGGVDAFQALQLAMVGIGSQLDYLKQTYKLQLSWLEGSNDLGFPTKVDRSKP